MIIKISNLGEGSHYFTFNEPVSDLGLSEPFVENFELEAEIMKSHNQIILNAGIDLKANFDCDRCTIGYQTIVHSEYQMVYLFGKEPVGDESYNVKYLSLEADKIDLTQDLKDYSVLAIPMKRLCKDDCKGICPTCGKDLNVSECGCAAKEGDARWLPLMDLKNKLSNN